MQNTVFRAEVVFGDVKSKDFLPPEQLVQLNNFLAKLLWIIISV